MRANKAFKNYLQCCAGVKSGHSCARTWVCLAAPAALSCAAAHARRAPIRNSPIPWIRTAQESGGLDNMCGLLIKEAFVLVF